MRWIEKAAAGISLLTFALLSGCGGSKEAPAISPDKAEPVPGKPQSWERGVARMYPRSASKVKGGLVFRESPEGLKVTGDLENLEGTSSYALTLHVTPDCNSPDAKSVGAIYDPDGAAPPAGLLGEAHGQANTDDKEVDLVVPHLKLNGPDSIVGLSVVVHAWPFDPEVELERVPFLACGVIEGD